MLVGERKIQFLSFENFPSNTMVFMGLKSRIMGESFLKSKCLVPTLEMMWKDWEIELYRQYWGLRQCPWAAPSPPPPRPPPPTTTTHSSLWIRLLCWICSIFVSRPASLSPGCASKRPQEKDHLTWKLGAHQKATYFSFQGLRIKFI